MSAGPSEESLGPVLGKIMPTSRDLQRENLIGCAQIRSESHRVILDLEKFCVLEMCSVVIYEKTVNFKMLFSFYPSNSCLSFKTIQEDFRAPTPFLSELGMPFHCSQSIICNLLTYNLMISVLSLPDSRQCLLERVSFSFIFLHSVPIT